MRPRVLAAIGLAAIALVATGVGWWGDPPALTAADAVDATEDALRGAGVDATVEPEPVRTTYATRTREPVDVWAVRATVRSEPIEVQLSRTGARPIAIDDRSVDGSAYVLSDLEYEAIVANVDDPARARTLRRNIVLTLAAALVVALAVVHAALSSSATGRPPGGNTS